MDSNLEMKCSVDEAWYDGTLSRVKGQIIVHFKDFDEDEESLEMSVLTDPAKLRSRVRVRSTQLQDSECKKVRTNQRICGCLDDGENRRYYDAEVVSIVPRDHIHKADGEECCCEFEVLWLAGPKKNERTSVGCAEICFLSEEIPEDDPMIKNLIEDFAGNREKRRRLVTKHTVSRPRTSLPSPEPIPLKKLSKRTSPHQSESRTASMPGEETRENMKTVGEQTNLDLSSDSDTLNDLNPGIRQTSSPKGGQNNEQNEASRLGNGGDVVEPKLPGGSVGKKVKQLKASRRVIVISPEDIHHDKGVRKTIRAETPQSSKGQVKSNSTKSATPKDVAVVGSHKKKLMTLGEKFIKQAELTLVEQPSRLNSKDDAAAERSNIVPEPVEQPKRKRGRPRKNPLPEDKIVEKSSYKTAEKSSYKTVEKSSPKTIENSSVKTAEKGSPQTADKSSAKSAERSSVKTLENSSVKTVEKSSAKTVEESAPKTVENSSAKTVNGSSVAKKQLVAGVCNVDKHGSVEDAMEENVDEEHFVPPFKKRLLTRMHAVDNTSSDATPVKSSNTGKQTLADRVFSVRMKHATMRNSTSKNAPTPTAVQPHSTKEAACQKQTQVEEHRATSPQVNSAQIGGQDETTSAQDIGASKKKRRRCSLVITDDEKSEDISEKSCREQNVKGANGNPVVDSYSAGGNKLAPLAATSRSVPKLVADVAPYKQDAINASRLLLIENMEEDVSAYDVMQLLQENTPGVCAVHIMPRLRFGVWTSGYILYQDHSSAEKALKWLTDYSVRFVISSNGRPWIVSPSEDVHEPRLYGFAAHTAFKIQVDNSGIIGIISDQPSAHCLSVVTKTSHSTAYSLALKKQEDYEKYNKWYMELREKIVEDAKKS